MMKYGNWSVPADFLLGLVEIMVVTSEIDVNSPLELIGSKWFMALSCSSSVIFGVVLLSKGIMVWPSSIAYW